MNLKKRNLEVESLLGTKGGSGDRTGTARSAKRSSANDNCDNSSRDSDS